FFLTTLRVPDVVDYVQKTFLASKESSPEEVFSPIPELTLDEAATVEVKSSSAYPVVQPMKSWVFLREVGMELTESV
ncbi:hypothetical protein C0995_001822, partial [Termitomyces sp. Mi166